MGKMKKSKWKCKECNSEKKSSHKDLCHKCYIRKWYKTEEGKRFIKKGMRITHKDRQNKYSLKNKDKIKAKAIAEYHILIKGLCQKCKINKAEHRHHQNYERPLEVELLCNRCHKEKHKELFDSQQIIKVNLGLTTKSDKTLKT